MTGARARAFVDTNVLLRAMMPELEGHKQAEVLIQNFWTNDVELWVNRQIIREFLVQATHPNTFTPPLEIVVVLTQLDTILSLFRVADDTETVTTQLRELLRVYPTTGKQIHDANLVATMLANEIEILLTFNTKDLKRFAEKIRLVSTIDESK